MDTNTPTNWILWEVNQPHIQQIIRTRKLRYWWKRLQSDENGLATQITKQNTSKIHKEVDEIIQNYHRRRPITQIPKHWATWKKLTKEWEDEEFRNTVTSTAKICERIDPIEIKPTTQLSPIFRIENEKTLNKILHIRAQTINLGCDVNPKTSNIICEHCKEHIITIEHLIFECRDLQQERQILFLELIEKLDERELKNINSLADKNKLEVLLGLKSSKSEEINLYLIQILAEYIYSTKER